LVDDLYVDSWIVDEFLSDVLFNGGSLILILASELFFLGFLLCDLDCSFNIYIILTWNPSLSGANFHFMNSPEDEEVDYNTTQQNRDEHQAVFPDVVHLDFVSNKLSVCIVAPVGLVLNHVTFWTKVAQDVFAAIHVVIIQFSVRGGCIEQVLTRCDSILFVDSVRFFLVEIAWHSVTSPIEVIIVSREVGGSLL
jgi:hypothetical protein